MRACACVLCAPTCQGGTALCREDWTIEEKKKIHDFLVVGGGGDGGAGAVSLFNGTLPCITGGDEH